jgi:hypothetical protein
MLTYPARIEQKHPRIKNIPDNEIANIQFSRNAIPDKPTGMNRNKSVLIKVLAWRFKKVFDPSLI